MAFAMNKQRQAHMDDKAPAVGKASAAADDVQQETGQHHAPSIHIHSHSGGHTVHVHHSDGTHTKHEHAHGDADGIAQHIHKHIGGGGSHDQSVDEGSLMESNG